MAKIPKSLRERKIKSTGQKDAQNNAKNIMNEEIETNSLGAVKNENDNIIKATKAKIELASAKALPGEHTNKKAKISKKQGEITMNKENIQVHLMNFIDNPEKYKLNGILTFLFRAYKSEPNELLAKIKVLTMKKKVNTSDMSIEDSVVLHLFALLEMKGQTVENNIFKYIYDNSILANEVFKWYFSQKMENEKALDYSNKLFEFILVNTRENTKKEFLDYLENVKLVLSGKSISRAVQETPEEADLKREKAEAVLAENNGAVFEESDFSLVSLNDDAMIEKLDARFGAIFAKGEIEEDKLVAISKALSGMELILKNNFLFGEHDLLEKLLFLFHIKEISEQVKFAVKLLLSKYSGKKQLFNIFLAASAQYSGLYELYGLILSQSAGEFDKKRFFTLALENNGEYFIANKSNLKEFAKAMEIDFSNVEEAHSEVLLSLLQKEKDVEYLKEIAATAAANEELSGAISERIERIQKKEGDKKKKDVKGAKKSKKSKKNARAQAVADEEPAAKESKPNAEGKDTKKSFKKNSKAAQSEVAGKPTETKQKRAENSETVKPKKRSFADKIGKRVAEKKEDNKKKFKNGKEIAPVEETKEKKPVSNFGRRDKSKKPSKK
ncbi:hypothetical protein ENBRE01_0201 [Enteropsectra breve]|nr:hypothetical protein ENBRE01_0201 [Enteropsectra breve]